MADFLDNQTVDAASLNQTAIDLGKPTFSNFVDGTQYNVDKLNEITASIVTAGIAAGVGNTCACTLSGGKISIGTGLIFFNSGAKMKIGTALSIDYTASDTLQYVYAYNDTSLNSVRIVADETEPTESMDTVMLCTIKSGVLTDMRDFSQARVSLPAAATVYQYEKTLAFKGGEEIQRDVINRNQSYTLAAVYDSQSGSYEALLLENGVKKSFPTGRYATVYLTKQGTKVIVSTHFAGSGTSSGTVKIWLI